MECYVMSCPTMLIQRLEGLDVLLESCTGPKYVAKSFA
ncbi:hypothetical protein SeseC_01275 [Streptococcus equi subsp. zooepidemicus ATCC 35246]|nr:hypothetical protein SeseC_01275 [Streptococcus equi subsp. zooepidemicus ATCC 35246]